MEYDDYSNFTETWETQEYYPWELTLTLMNVLQGLATVAGLLVNALLLVLFAATPRLRNVPNTLLLQRSIADVIALIPFPIVIYARANRNFQFRQTLCTSFNIFLHVGVVASHMFLMAFILDAYQATYPQQYTFTFRRKTMRFTSTVAWALAAAAGVAAYFFGYIVNEEHCNFGPLFDESSLLKIFPQMFALFVVPMVVVWVLVSVALPSRPSDTSVEPKVVGKEGPNRRLMLGVASSFTVLHGLYWLVLILNRFLPLQKAFIITPIAYSLTVFSRVVNPILVICLSEGLRQKVAGCLPSRPIASVPLQDMRAS